MKLATDSLTPVHWLAIGLAALSGAIHLVLAIIVPIPALRVGFLLAGGGFFCGIALVLANYRRTVLYAVGIPFTGGQIVLWYVLVGPTPATIELLDAIDKLAQVVLLGLLVLLYVRKR
ncbi:MAG: hypothetical protein IH933_01715 [Euryarchaeota archaeon]|jgi:hypothetical protein|nr:hypothetical protein [Euryarchaeota archaeon]